MIVDADSAVAGNGLELTHFAVDTADLGYYGGRGVAGPMDVAVADFNLDGNEDVVAVWEGPGRSITGFLPHFDPTNLSWSENSPNCCERTSNRCPDRLPKSWVKACPTPERR